MYSRVTFGVAVEDVAFGVAVFGGSLRPVVEPAVDFGLYVAGQFRDRTDSFVTTDVLRHLHVVVIRVSAFHRLDAPVEFHVVLIDEKERAVAVQPDGGLAFSRMVFSGGPFVPVVDIQEFGVGLQGVLPAFLEIDSVVHRVLYGFPEPGYIGRFGHVVFVQFRFAVLFRPRFADSDAFAFDHRDRMLGRCDGGLFAFAFVGRKQFFGFHIFDPGIGHIISETPVIFGSDETLVGPFVVAPPHRAQREEVFHVVGIVRIIFSGIVRVAVMRIVFVSHGVFVVVQIRIRRILSVGVVFRGAVIEQQRFAVPVEP